MNIEYIKTQELKSYKTNTRTHSSEQVDQLVNSITEFGFTNPILIDGERQIIAGHGRLAAAKKLLMDEIPCIVLDHLNDEQRRAYVIADNKLALNSGWDEDLLKLEFSALDRIGFDLSVLGFDANELSNLIIDEDSITGGITDEDDVPEVVKNSISKLGDVWILGEHRLMCGDSTSADDMAVLINDKKTDMVFTDPPYGMSYSGGRTNKFDMIKGDDLDPTVFYHAIPDAREVYIWGRVENYQHIKSKPNYVIVWKKENFGLGRGYRGQYEVCFYWGEFSGSDSDVWEVSRARNYVHPTQKPVELCLRAIENSQPKNILDLYSGSGSTLIACEKKNLPFMGMEFDPKYVDVIVKRWQEYTGKEAFNEVSGQKFNEALNG
jgi:DNA modification methylase